MDFATLDTVKAANDGADYHVRHFETDQPLYLDEDQEKPVTIRIVGKDSDRFKRMAHAKIDKLTAEGRRKAKSAKETEAELIQVVADCVIGWGNIKLEGKMLEYTPANVVMFLQRFPWVFEQLNEAIADRGNFLAGRTAVR